MNMQNMKNSIDFYLYRGVHLGLVARKTWQGVPPNEATKHGIHLVATKKFSRSNFAIQGQEGFCRDFKETATGFAEQSTGQATYLLDRITFTWRGLTLRYIHSDKNNSEYGFIRPRRVPGLRLELEVPRADLDSFDKCIMEYDEDPVLGKILRIWETSEGIEYRLTCLENGSAIETRPSGGPATVNNWHWRED